MRSFAAFTLVAAEAVKDRVDRIFKAYNKPDFSRLRRRRDSQRELRLPQGYGVGSLELGLPLSSRSVFYMGSVSKQFTAASVVLAAEQAANDAPYQQLPGCAEAALFLRPQRRGCALHGGADRLGSTAESA